MWNSASSLNMGFWLLLNLEEIYCDFSWCLLKIIGFLVFFYLAGEIWCRSKWLSLEYWKVGFFIFFLVYGIFMFRFWAGDFFLVFFLFFSLLRWTFCVVKWLKWFCLSLTSTCFIFLILFWEFFVTTYKIHVKLLKDCHKMRTSYCGITYLGLAYRRGCRLPAENLDKSLMNEWFGLLQINCSFMYVLCCVMGFFIGSRSGILM